MSDAVNAEPVVETAPAPAAPQTPADAPVLKPAPKAAMAPVPVGDHDTSILSHLGLPFYYRHSPNRTVLRGTIWIMFVLLLGLVFVNVLHMPYNKDTFMYSIRATLFSTYGGHTSVEDGAQSLFNQFYVIAIIISGIIAPLYATFSFSSERVLGTLEFLRLSPMSTMSIVMGKMFAPAYMLHVISGIMLAIGTVFGLVGGLPAYDMFFAFLTIVFSSATITAIGAFLAAYTASFRGFGAVALLLFIGFMTTVMSLEFLRERGMTMFAYLSPFGAMDNLFWNELVRYRSPAGKAMFAGSQALVMPAVLASHGLFFGLLVWAASRKLDRTDRPALPKMGYVILWSFFFALAWSMVPNFAQTQPNVMWGPSIAWQAAAIIVLFGSMGTCILALLDHPHQRELVLTGECERVAGRENAPGASWQRLSHALFVSLLVFLSGAAMVFFIYKSEQMLAASVPQYQRSFEWAVAATMIVAGVVSAFLFSVILECAWVRFSAFWIKLFAALVVISVFLAAVIAPIIHAETAMRRFQQVTYAALNYHTSQASGAPRTNNRYSYGDYQWLKSNPDFAPYIPGTETLGSTKALKDKYKNDSLQFFWDYHTQAFVVYPLVFLALTFLLFYWRHRTYLALRREAIRAVGPPNAAAVAA